MGPPTREMKLPKKGTMHATKAVNLSLPLVRLALRRRAWLRLLPGRAGHAQSSRGKRDDHAPS